MQPSIYRIDIPHTDRSGRRAAETDATLTLIHRVLGREVTLTHTPSGAPLLLGSDLLISISHCTDCAVVALCPPEMGVDGLGVDVELWRDQLQRISSRFLSAEESGIWNRSDETLLKAWTAKEAIFKAAGVNGMTITDIILPKDTDCKMVKVGRDTFAIDWLNEWPRMICVACRRGNPS